MSQDQFNKNDKFPRFQPNRDENKKGGPKFSNYWIWAILLATVIGFSIYGPFAKRTQPITVGDFKEMLLKHHVEKYVEVPNKNLVRVSIKKDSLRYYADKLPTSAISNKKDEKPPQFSFEANERFREEILEFKKQNPASFPNESDSINDPYVSERDSTWFSGALNFLLPVLLFLAIWILLMRKMSGGGGAGGGPGGIFNIGKSKATLFDKGTKVNITFADVAGLDEAKVEVMEIVDFLKNPKKYTNLGGKIPKGALLIGPPGTGKTLLAKAMAGEAQVPFFSLSGSDFVEMFVGVGASRVRDLFKQAREKAPAIIFIDEIDAVGRARGKNNFSGSNDERENTLNQLLTEMDGFGTNTHVIVLAATNRADVLDKALMRAGRFDRQIFVDLPDIRERAEIFKVHLAPIKKVEGLDLDFLAKQTPGFSGADIANVCNEAALIAARYNKTAVDKQDFLDAVDRIIGGLEKKNKIITPEEKRAIAIHEAGHATVSWMLEHAAPLIKVTIVPRGQSLGAAWYLPEERLIVRTDQMLDEMCATMGGRAAEKVTFDRISTGALSDLEKVTKQARAMVTVYGLNEKIGNVTYYDSSGQSEYSFSKPYSDETAKVIDKEISDLIESQYQRAITILEENKDKLEQLASILIEKEVIFKDDLETIFGKRTFDKNLGEVVS